MSEAGVLACERYASAPAENATAKALSLAAMARSLPRDRQEEAANLMRTAFEHVAADMLNLRADLMVERARLSAASGLASDAQEPTDHAVDLYRHKGNPAAAHNFSRA